MLRGRGHPTPSSQLVEGRRFRRTSRWLRESALSRVVDDAGQDQEDTMGKTGRKRRGRKKKAANHGKRPNA
jgi:hypothetical protein